MMIGVRLTSFWNLKKDSDGTSLTSCMFSGSFLLSAVIVSGCKSWWAGEWARARELEMAVVGGKGGEG
jgi:hypothetical protein